MGWIWALLAIAVCFAVAFAFRLALSKGRRVRGIAWLVASFCVGLAPCLVPLAAPSGRLLAAMIAVAILVKLYDLWRQSPRAATMTVPAYALNLVNWLWLVLGDRPSNVPRARDWKRITLTLPVAAAMVAGSYCVFSIDWARLPFAIEHSVKVLTLILTVVVVTNGVASGWRLAGGVAWDPMRNPAAARTPADFWRRWNVPVQKFFEEYVFYPVGGRRQPVRGILAVFVVSGLVHEYLFGIAAGRVLGWQFVFFALEGLATVGTVRLRPRGWMVVPFVVVTIALNLVLSVLFFDGVDSVVPFYSPRG